jgi:hypothetical protein
MEHHEEEIGMAASSPDEEFKVMDRRRRVDEEPPAAPAAPPSPSAAAGSRAPTAAPPTTAASAAAVSPAAEGTASEARTGRPTLEGLFVMLASSAVMAMGDAPDPATGDVRVDPAMAADSIDLLVLLREKTEGNRTPEETQLLDELIYDLQLRYVAAIRKRG